jgi:hypothetical protein
MLASYLVCSVRIEIMGSLKKTPLILAILFILAVWVGPFVWEWDFFQKTFFPKNYWQKQVEAIEKNISMNDHIIRSTLRDLQKIQLTAGLDVADKVDLAVTASASPDIARDQAVGEINQQVEANRLIIKNVSEKNVKLKQDLEKARADLSQYK